MLNLQPSLLVANVFDPISRNEERIMTLYREIASLDFYRSIETRVIFDDTIRQEFASFSRDVGWNVTLWLTSNLNEKGFNLSSEDDMIRQQSVSYMKELLDLANESNASYVGFGSGKWQTSPEISFPYFYSSLTELMEYVSQYPQLNLLLEPLDMLADKKFTIGSVSVIKELFERIKADPAINETALFLCLDSAHFALNDDDFENGIRQLGKYSNRVHFANAVLDPESKLYGDKHMRFGEPGFLTEAVAHQISQTIKETEFREKKVYLTAEVRGGEEEDLWQLEDECAEFIQKLLQ